MNKFHSFFWIYNVSLNLQLDNISLRYGNKFIKRPIISYCNNNIFLSNYFFDIKYFMFEGIKKVDYYKIDINDNSIIQYNASNQLSNLDDVCEFALINDLLSWEDLELEKGIIYEH
jgi:hypothetical protein